MHSNIPGRPGWYPDPNRTGQLRYWDGHRWQGWTSPTLPASATRPWRRHLWWIIPLTLALLVGSGMAVRHASNETQSTKPRIPAITGTHSDWVAAVCLPNTYSKARRVAFPDYCQSRNAYSPNADIEIASFQPGESPFDPDERRNWFNAMVFYTVYTADDGHEEVFATGFRTNAPLTPLSQFGFTTQRGPNYH